MSRRTMSPADRLQRKLYRLMTEQPDSPEIEHLRHQVQFMRRRGNADWLRALREGKPMQPID